MTSRPPRLCAGALPTRARSTSGSFATRRSGSSTSSYAFEFGRAVVVREGRDVTLISTGAQTPRVVDAAELLAAQGIEAHVLHVPTIKPLDVPAIVAAANRTGFVVTVEEGHRHRRPRRRRRRGPFRASPDPRQAARACRTSSASRHPTRRCSSCTACRRPAYRNRSRRSAEPEERRWPRGS